VEIAGKALHKLPVAVQLQGGGRGPHALLACTSKMGELRLRPEPYKHSESEVSEVKEWAKS